MFGSSAARLWRAVGALALLSCDDPTRILDVPDVRAMRVFMILNPDSSAQFALVQHTSGEALPGLRGEILENATLRASAFPGGEGNYDEMLPCIYRYGTLVNSPRCLSFQFKPRFGVTYDVAIASVGRETARATTTIPGDFRIVSRTTAGTPPGVTNIRATWTRSAGVFRYVVAIRGNPNSGCPPEYQCSAPIDNHPRWMKVTEDTSIAETVDAQFFDEAKGPWFLDVYAMNRELYAHLMTGAPGDFFPVPPAQNVVGGLGAIGAWVRRSAAIP